MTSLIAKYIGKKLLGETLQNNFGKEDPYFEQVPATRLYGGGPSKTRTTKRRKALPPGISEHDGMILTKVKRRAYRLDMSLFNCCGIRFGWSSVIGIIPGFGDLLDAFMAMMVLRTCQQVEGGLPANVKSKMMFNIILDFFVGLVPFLGDIADALFRANTRNAVELENYLRKKGAENIKAQGGRLPAVDPTDPHEFDKLENAAPPEYTTTAPTQQAPMCPAASAQGVTGTATETRETRPDPSGSKSGGWFSGFGRKSKSQDEEMAMTGQPSMPPRPAV